MYVPPVLLRLGSRAFDVRTRALVTAVVDAAPDGLAARAGALVAAGADVLVVEGGDGVVKAVEVLMGVVDIPVGVATPAADLVDAALEAGATLAEDRTGEAGQEWLAAAARAGAAVALACLTPSPGGRLDAALRARAAEAQAAGVAPDRIAVDPGAVIRPAPRVGYPLVLDAGKGSALAAASVGIALGYRVVRTADVRVARRVADAVAAVLEAE